MSHHLSEDFIERQRQRLEAMRDRFSDLRTRARNEERDLTAQYASEVQDSGDQSALDAHRDVDDALGAENERRASDIRRALEKIEQGTYGLSDESGEPIPQARLEAMPEARYTIEEEERRESNPT